MQKIFSFKGITRNTDVLYAKEGECENLVNMRIRNGSLIPMGEPQTVSSLPYKYVSIHYHELSKKYLCITSDDGFVHVYNEDFNFADAADNATVAVLSPHCVGVRRIEFVGNIVCLFTDDSTFYAIYDTNYYKWLGERPYMPSLSFTINSQVHEVTTDEAYYSGMVTGDEYKSLLWLNVAAGYYDECIANLNENGCYIDRALFRYAFKLFDGSYAYLSPIYYVEDNNSVGNMARDSQNFYSISTAPLNERSTYKVKVQGFKPVFKFEDYDLGEWENIIVSIDVFTSGSIMGHKIVENGRKPLSRNENTYTSDSMEYVRYEYKTTTELYADVTSQNFFYKVAEYDLKGKLVDELKNVSPTNLALSSMLTDDSTSHVGRTAAYTYVFNGRLHLAGLSEKLFKGYEAHMYAPVAMECTTLPAVVVTHIRTERGTSVVKYDYGNSFVVGHSEGKYYLSPFIMYPDARAVKIIFYITIEGTVYSRMYNLTRHKILNLAYHLHETGDGISVTLSGQFAKSVKIQLLSAVAFKKFFSYKIGSYELVYNGQEEWVYGNEVFAKLETSYSRYDSYNSFGIIGVLTPGDKIFVTIADAIETGRMESISNICIDELWEQSLSLPPIEECNVVEKRGNIMKVSEVDNPFFFPVKQTYTPSNEDIVAVCSNTAALSQGQFGQHPLYVFCTNGIWVMSTDNSGEIVYSTSYPLSREACINPLSVRAIDTGVVFITSKGVMLLDGGSVTLLSTALCTEGRDNTPTDENGIVSRIASIVGMNTLLLDDYFINYCKNASVGFFYSERELLLSNVNYSYSYVFSLENGQWSKYTATFDYISNSYPHFLGIKNDGENTKVLMLDRNTVGSNAIMLLSRPLLCGTKLHKRIVQLVLHASVKPADSSAKFNGLACYLLCSNDGKNYKLVSGSERQTEFHDMVFPYVPTQSYRYLALAIVGNITTDSSIAAVEMAVNVAWNNKLN